jgi:copper(I)-binding protein
VTGPAIKEDPMKRMFALALLVALGGAPALAEEFKAGEITIDQTWARATPKGAEVGAGYLTIHNNGATPERLIGGTADFANVELHELSREGDVMKMRELKEGLAIPAHGSVTLAPGGYHLMFTRLKKPLAKGDVAKATLNFDHAGAIAIEFPVRDLGSSGGSFGAKSEMNGMKM